MVFKIDFETDEVLVWSKTTDGASYKKDSDYSPSIYVDGSDSQLEDLRADIGDDPKIVSLGRCHRYVKLHAEERSEVLRINLERMDETRTLAREIRRLHEKDRYPPGTFKLFNVDFAPQFRYCLETETSPIPEHRLTMLELDIGEKALAEQDISTLGVDGDVLSGDEEVVLESVHNRIRDSDPDVLVLKTADIIPVLYEKAEEFGFDDFEMGRLPGWTQLAGESTFESYGRVGHSPARYNLPGRVILDKSNSFMWSQSDLEGLLYLVERSWKPLQETGWGSIGNILTAIQIREAVERDVLVPWNKWEPEEFKDVRTLHEADRGGFTFEPQVGLHEDVYEVDFSSLYPYIICEYNISPDTILCDCHADRADIPELGYNVCDDQGFLPDVLQPLLDDREEIKQRLRENPDEMEEETLSATSNAIKWILVSCFGYQGYRNSKFGRIECHEAINAVARDILLTSKEIFESHGWEIVHGIVDSLWIRPTSNDAADLDPLIDQISEEVGIRLDFESQYDWICFVPKRESNSGALTKYFGKNTDDEYKYRGIEIRQRSTPDFIEESQREFINALDHQREARAVCDVLKRRIEELRSGAVDPEKLVVRQRVSKEPEEYSQRTKSMVAMKRYREKGVTRYSGQDVQYVVVNDDPDARERVKLHFEDLDQYDADFYVDLLVRACESITSPLGWDRDRIRQYLRKDTEIGLSAFTAGL